MVHDYQVERNPLRGFSTVGCLLPKDGIIVHPVAKLPLSLYSNATGMCLIDFMKLCS